jgi:diacylglycerol kinase family enzyme
MRICLFWTERAGEGISLDEISSLLERHGHHIARIVNKTGDLPRKLDGSFDCVVTAGGDGTVARAGRALAGGDVPLAILPMGTANNIATSLGINGEPSDLIPRWADGRVVHIDVGTIQDVRGETRFLEGVGAGLIVAGILKGSAAISRGSEPAARLAHARELVLQTIERLTPQHHTITIDGAVIEGDYLLVEVLNIPSVGPNVRLSADTSPADGLLSVVVAGESDRGAISAYLRAEAHGMEDAGLKSWRGARVELKGLRDYHVDDEVRAAGGGAVSIGITPLSLGILA